MALRAAMARRIRSMNSQRTAGDSDLPQPILVEAITPRQQLERLEAVSHNLQRVSQKLAMRIADLIGATVEAEKITGKKIPLSYRERLAKLEREAAEEFIKFVGMENAVREVLVRIDDQHQ